MVHVICDIKSYFIQEKKRFHMALFPMFFLFMPAGHIIAKTQDLGNAAEINDRIA